MHTYVHKTTGAEASKRFADIIGNAVKLRGL
jgi:hypothetical protein